MKKKVFLATMAVVVSAALVPAFGYSVMAEEAEEVQYDFGTEGILDLPMYPETYKEEAEHPGTVTAVTYDNGEGEKFFNIYVPYGYEDNTDSYNVLYIVHGGGGTPNNYINPEKATGFQKVIDHMFEDRVCDPFILVSVSWKPAETEIEQGYYSEEQDYTVLFARDELPNCIVPYVDEHYRTNADRDHRAFSGFSMGGCTTWNVLMYDLKDFATLIPLSGDCWAVEQTGGKTKPAETAEAIAQAITAQGMTADDFRIFAATGSVDMALENLAPQIIAMQENEMFRFGENTFWGVMEGINHGDPNARYYLYTIMPMVW